MGNHGGEGSSAYGGFAGYENYGGYAGASEVGAVWGVACLCKIGKQRGRDPSQPVLIA